MVWLWQHQFSLQKLQPATLIKVLKLKDPVGEPNPFAADVKEWKNN